MRLGIEGLGHDGGNLPKLALRHRHQSFENGVALHIKGMADEGAGLLETGNRYEPLDHVADQRRPPFGVERRGRLGERQQHAEIGLPALVIFLLGDQAGIENPLESGEALEVVGVVRDHRAGHARRRRR